MPMSTLHLRPAGEADEAFLADLYRATRADLLALPLEPALIDDLVAMQHKMQVAGYRHSHPDASYQVLELDGVAVGRVVTAPVAGAMRLVDIAVAPPSRGKGVAREVVRRLQARAARTGLDLTLAVRKDNPAACRLYAQLGFVAEGEDELGLALRWRARPGSTGSVGATSGSTA